jgi:hypothetical protein
MRRTTVLASLLVLASLAGCQDDPPNISLLQLERGGAIDFVCLCEASDGSWSGSEMTSCDPDSGDPDCSIFGLVLQTNRGEIAVVDLQHNRLHDSDERAPFTTFPHVGAFPSDLVVSRDGTRIYVVHVGEPTLAIVDTSGILGPTLPEPTFVDLPVEAQSVDLTRDLSHAFVTLPSAGAIGRIVTESDPPIVDVLLLVGDVPPPDEPPDASTDAEEDVADDAEEDVPDDLVEDVPGDAEEDVPDDLVEDVPGDVVEEDAGSGVPASFRPVEIKIVEADAGGRVFVSGFTEDGGGGVLELDLDRLLGGGDVADALLAVHLEGTPVAAFEVVDVVPTWSDETTTPEGRFLYAANRDEPRLHVVDLDTGEEIDTSQSDPFAGRAIPTDGNVVDVLAISFDDESDESTDDYELDPLEMRGVFVFVLTSTGVVEVVDVYDRACWWFMTNPSTDDDPVSCTPHVLRNVFDEEDSFPRWLDEPALMNASGETITFLPQTCDMPTPCFDHAGYVPVHSPEHPSYGVTFFPDVPPPGTSSMPVIRRAVSETWGFIWEGNVPWTSGVGGNLSTDGMELDDPGMYFCAMGVMAGDALVIDDGPAPLDTDVDCSGFPSEGGAAYGIVEATQHALVLERVAQFDPETDQWVDGFDLPREECFPFAVQYHVRASNQWVVSASETGFLHSTTVAEDGSCTQSLPPCTDWDDGTDCTLLTGRASMDRTYVNPYIRFTIRENGVATPPSDETILRPGLGFFFPALSGFQPLATKAATLPHTIAYSEQLDALFISDRAWDGLLQFSPHSFSVVYEYN